MHQRKKYIINRPFQFKIAFYICSWVIALSFIYPFIVMDLFDSFAAYLAMDPNGPQISVLIDQRKNFLFCMGVFEVLFFGAAFLGSLFMAHRIAGPLYQLQNALKRFQNGIFDQPVKFRKKDYFLDLAVSANALQDALSKKEAAYQEQMASATQALEAIQGQIEKKGLDSALCHQIEKALLMLKNKT